VAIDDCSIAIEAPRSDFVAYRGDPGREPLTQGDAARVDMLADIDCPEQPAKLALGILAVAPNGCGRDPPPAGRGICAEAVAQLERAGRPFANVSGTTHLSFSLASFAAVEGDPVPVRAEFGVGSSTAACTRLKPITAISALSDGGTARKFLGGL